MAVLGGSNITGNTVLTTPPYFRAASPVINASVRRVERTSGSEWETWLSLLSEEEIDAAPAPVLLRRKRTGCKVGRRRESPRIRRRSDDDGFRRL
jgi:hypothetical protein